MRNFPALSNLFICANGLIRSGVNVGQIAHLASLLQPALVARSVATLEYLTDVIRTRADIIAVLQIVSCFFKKSDTAVED